MSVSRFAVLVLALVLLATATPALAKDVFIDRILREHYIYVVSTEPEVSLSKFLFDLRMKEHTVLSFPGLFYKQKSLKDGQSLLYIVDRSKLDKLLPEEEALLPVPTSAIDDNQVVLYAVKAKGRNAWDIMISAPNQKWLQWELDRLSKSPLIGYRLEERGSILDRFLVKRLCIVSTEAKQVAEDWVNRQSRPGEDAIDWDFLPLDAWDPSLTNGIDLLFLLDSQKSVGKFPVLSPAMPKGMESWIGSEESREEIVAETCTLPDANGQPRSVHALVAPCNRHLKSSLARYSTLDSIPKALSKQKLIDLSGYSHVVVFARPGNRADGDDNGWVNDFGGKLTSALSSSASGLQCVSRQDLKELVYYAIPSGSGNIVDSMQLTKIRQKVGKACAIAIADLTAVDESTTYVANSPRCETSPYPAFSMSEPAKPEPPDLDERKYILAGPKKYSGRNDPDYKEALDKYYDDELPEYEKQLRQWRAAREDDEYRRTIHEMTWTVSVDIIQSARVSGNLRIYDLRSLDSGDAGQVIFSCPISGEAQHRGVHTSESVVVRGEGNQPNSPSAPQAHPSVDDTTVTSEALQRSCESAVGEVVRTAILPCDMLDFDPQNLEPIEIEPEPVVVKSEHVSVQAVGAAPLESRPVGGAPDDVREAAIADAHQKLMLNMRVASPNAVVSLEDLSGRIRVVSEGWNPVAREYRVRVEFEGDVQVSDGSETAL